MAQAVPGALLDSFDELKAVIQKRARLSKRQREHQLRLGELERIAYNAQELFVHEAQRLYNAMSEGEIESEKAESEANKANEILQDKLGTIEAERSDLERRLEALRRSLDQVEGEIEMTLKTGAPEQISGATERILEHTSELEQKVFAAQEEARKTRDEFQVLQFLDGWLSKDQQTAPRRIGANGSFGSGPESRLIDAMQRTQEIAAEIQRIREVLAGEGEEQQAEPEQQRTRVLPSGTVEILVDDDD